MSRLIDADALKDLEEMEYTYFKSPAAVPFYEADKVWEVIDYAPTIEAEPVRHGRWETHNQVDSVFYCSECKLNVSGFERRWLNYCPNCGVKMDKEDE